MAQIPQPSVENSFIGGLKTEFTGLNFPENSCTDADNVIFTIIGDVTRREGFNFEANAAFAGIDRAGKAMSTYKWNNVGGDGSTQIVVTQIGSNLYFYRSSSATIALPLSTTSLGAIDFSQFSTVTNIAVVGVGAGAANVINLQVASTIGLTTGDTVTISGVLGTTEANGTFQIIVTGPINMNLVGTTFVHAYTSGGTLTKRIDVTECQYTDGNGYLFVFHTNCDPFYVTYSAGSLIANVISIKIRDFVGIPETGVADNYRPLTLTADHHYNLYNQGWQAGAGWSATSTTNNRFLDGQNTSLTITAGLTISNGDGVTITAVGLGNTVNATVVSYVGGTGALIVTCNSGGGFGFWASWSLVHSSDTLINTWFTGAGGGPAQNNYPSNADQWWQFKNSSGVFSTSTVSNITLNQGPAPKGYFALSAFNIDRAAASNIAGITAVSTTVRPRTGSWYQGRVWYTGVDASFAASGDAPFSTWTENIYFSQVVETTSQFAKCHQVNDPTSENLFSLLPTDGGVIVIQGSGSIYKLVPVKMGMIVFAANGIWYITGSQGTGFSATDYTIIKISNIQAISGTSFINVQGFPMFWNEEGIYYVAPSQQGGSAHSPDIALDVQNLALGTILTFFGNIPLQSKKFARGDFHPLDYVVQWCYRDTNESSVTDRYQFNRILNFNIATKAFYTYTTGTTNGAYIHGINYVAGPGGSTSPTPVFKYLTSYTASPYNFTFSEERDTTFVDWAGLSSTGYTSSFTSGYNLKGKAITKFQVPYTYMFSRNPAENKYKIQSVWDYAGTGNSGRWSVQQIIDNNNNKFNMLYRKHRLRGRGLAVQIRITSMPGFPFDLMGWSMYAEVNQGI